MRGTQPTNISSTTPVQLLKWLHGKQQQQQGRTDKELNRNTAIYFFKRGNDVYNKNGD